MQGDQKRHICTAWCGTPSMLPAKVKQMMFFRLNRDFIPEIRAINKAKQDTKGR